MPDPEHVLHPMRELMLSGYDWGDIAEDRLDAFAYRIARNAIIDHYRARAAARERPEAPEELVARVDADGMQSRSRRVPPAKSSPAASRR